MINRKYALLVVAGALAVSLGLVACGGGASNSGSASSAAVSSAAASAEASSASVLTSDYWAGTLADGSTVDYFDDVESDKPGLVILSADGTEGKAWVGALDVEMDGSQVSRMTITDDNTKETVAIIPNDSPAAGTMQWEIEGYGEVTLKKDTTGLYQEHLEQVGKLAQ